MAAGETQKIEWAVNPLHATESLKPITDALTSSSIPPLSVSWERFVSMLGDEKNNRLCRGEYASIIFLTGDHIFDVLVIARTGGLIDGILGINFLPATRGVSERDMSILYVNQICVAGHAKGLGKVLMAKAEEVATRLGLRAIQLVSGTSATNAPGPSGRPKLLQWYLNQGYNWVNQRRKSYQYPMLVKPLTAEGRAELERLKQEAAAAEAAAAAAAPAAPAWPSGYVAGGEGLATPPSEKAEGAGGAGGLTGDYEMGVPLPTAKGGIRKRKSRKNRKSSRRSRR